MGQPASKRDEAQDEDAQCDARANPLADRLGPRELTRALAFLAPRDVAASAASCARWEARARDDALWRELCSARGIAAAGAPSWRDAFEREARRTMRRAGRDEAREYDHVVRAAMVGNTAVGKTSFQTRFADGVFTNTFKIPLHFKIVILKYGGKVLKLQLWDPDGEVRRRADTLSTAYYRGAHALLLMFDLTDRTSFAALDNWLRQIRMHARSAAPVVLIGTKQDRVDKRAVTREEAADFASHHALEYVECSSLSGENVDAAVAEMLHELMKPDADFEAGSRFEQQLAENRARRAETVRKESWWYRWGLSRSTPRGSVR